MITQVKAIADRFRDTLLADFLGATALFVTLLGGLYLLTMM